MRALINPSNFNLQEKWADGSVEVMSESLARLSASTQEALQCAIIDGDVARINNSLKGGASPEWEDGGALGLAVRMGHVHLVSLFAKPGSSLPHSLLRKVVLTSNCGMMRALVAGGVSLLDGEGRCSLLQLALGERLLYGDLGTSAEMVEAILEAKPNLDGIVIRDPLILLDNLDLWLRCPGLRTMCFELQCPNSPKATESLTLLIDTLVSQGSASDATIELLHRLAKLECPIFQEPANLIEWLKIARESGGGGYSLANCRALC